MFAFAGFIGFEATAIFRDEARDPDRTIPRATYAAVILIGLFYAFAGWALVMAWGPSKVVQVAEKNAGGMIYDTAQTYLGTVGAVAIQTLLLTSMFACILSFHNVLTRYQYVMGGVKVLPASLNLVHVKHASPHVSSLAQTAVSGALVALFAVLGLDPVLQGFTWMSGVATIGVIVLMALTSVAVVTYFRRNPDAQGNLWKSQVAPVIATIGLVGAAAVVVAYFPTLVGGGWGLCLSLLALVPAVMVIGIAQTLHLRRRTPVVYAALIEAISA
jgi:amino acid transporter